jgi:hypothetical protein
VRVVTPPKNGRLEIDHDEDFPNFNQDNVRFNCNTQKLAGTIVRYQSNPGFIGDDYTIIEIL